MISLLSQKKESLNEQVTTAELYYTIFVSEHNLAFSTKDHFTKLCIKMFPDSKIAEGFACGATKTQAIIKSALAPALNENVIKACASSPFTTILCDGSNDQDVRKYFAIMVRFWDESAHCAISQFLAMPVCNVDTAQAMFDLSKELECHKIPWSNVIGYTSDTASVMVGKNNS